MNRSLRSCGLLLLLAAASSWAATDAATEQQWQQHMQEMQQMHQSWMAGKTPEERQKLMLEHQKAMGGGMQMMGGCPMQGGMQGMGMGAGKGMMQLDTVEQVDQRIKHMEQMIEQLRAHREMLEKS
jgi:outer membrane biogenesis lipoprotein LolB